MPEIDIETARGLARAHLAWPAGETATAGLVLGHGAGGGIGAPDLRAARDAALALGFAVALVEQPYRVAGRRAPAPAAHLDGAWLAVISQLTARELRGLPLVCGGRSMGARVACRTADAAGARGVLCLAFPLMPPPRAAATKPAVSRLSELDGVRVPALIVQGERDRFGIPPSTPDRSVVVVAGDHGLKADTGAVAQAVGAWLQRLLPANVTA